MLVREIMTEHVKCLSPQATLQQAADQMRAYDVGALPICDSDRLTGMITDRDLIIRGMARGLDPSTTLVQDVMSGDVIYCFDGDQVEEAVSLMENHQVRRIIVLNTERRLAGILSLGDVAVRTRDFELSGEALEQVSEPALFA